jgi:uncharacterized 2Fe-2S/4Fe-4S cluster protein (DUF4445 family)
MPAGASWKGISGTGYISLLAMAVRMGLVDEWGRLQKGTTPLARRVPVRRDQHGRMRMEIVDDLVMDGQDIEAILLVKAACNAAVVSLLDRAGLRVRDLRQIFLAGALGTHCHPRDLTEIGFFPDIPGCAFLSVGDAALDGLWQSVLAPDSARDWFSRLTGRTRALDLSQDAKFSSLFLSCMRIGFR